MRGRGVEQAVDLLERGGDILRRGAVSAATTPKGRGERPTFFETLVRATISLNVRGTRPCLQAIKMHAAMMAVSFLLRKIFSSSTRLNSIFVVSMMLLGRLIASHMVAISRNAFCRSRPVPPCWSLATRCAAIWSERATPVLLSLNEMTVESWSAASRSGSAGPPTRDGSSPSESAKERPAHVRRGRQRDDRKAWLNTGFSSIFASRESSLDVAAISVVVAESNL